MNRRAFLSMLAAGAAGLAIDPEFLTWRQGAKSIFLPPPPSLLAPQMLQRGDIFTIEGVYLINPITQAELPRLKEFVIVHDVQAGATVSQSMSPRILSDGLYRNVSRAPFQNAQVQPLMVGDVKPVITQWLDHDTPLFGPKMRSLHRGVSANY